MSEENKTTETYIPTPLDESVQNRPLLLLKTAIPYLPPSQGRMLAMIVKIMELQRVNEMYDSGAPELAMCEGMSNNSRMCQLLEAIKPYCVPEELGTIDFLLNILSVADLSGELFS